MAIATDEAGIQFRILNSRKGPAVRATRAQADRLLYKQAIRTRLENQPNLTIFQQAVDDLLLDGNRVVGVFRNDFARRMLAASLPAGIEAPVRFYVTENADGTGSLSYRLPSAVFAPYFAAEGGDLRAVAGELDIIFARITADAIAP